MDHIIDQIDAYLDGTLSAEEKISFENQLGGDESLRQQLNTQRNLRAGIDRLGMKAATASTFRKMTLKNKIYKWGIATVAVVAVATTIYYGAQAATNSQNGPEITYELPATNEEGNTNWAQADRNLPTQLFTINPNQDTVIETMNGIVFAIPAGAFLNAGSPFTLEVREALTPMDIMKGGLSTTSNGELLETGGMFYINARNGETSLKINPDKPVYANIPTNEIRPGMMLFDGERKDDGSINWVNPKQMEKQLIPVDIFSLNFYPDGFLEKVAELGFDANNKKVTDSIYYSYAGRQRTGGAMPLPGFYSEIINDTVAQIALDDSYSGIDGEALFEQKCSSCHSATDQKTTGPGLRGVLGRIPGGNWKYDWVHNSAALIKSGDPYANKIYGQYKTIEPAFPELTNEAIDAILAFADHRGKPYGMEIDPARIAAIKDDKFQNTIIATKEFEERLRLIFDIGVPEILDMYVNNLDKKMFQIDSMVCTNAPKDSRNSEFQKFYDRHDGGVTVSQSHMKELQEYYGKKQEAVRFASQKTYNERTAGQRKQDSIYLGNSDEYWQKGANQSAQNFTKEYNINLKEAYRQLGINASSSPAPHYYSFEVNSPGWANVDAYVFQSAATRTTLDYADPVTGKKAVIKYEELKIVIADATNYTQVMVYLVTADLPFFQKVDNSTGEYKENLNELLEYGLVVIAEKDGIWFSAITPKVTPGSVNVTLVSTDESSLRNTLNSTFKGSVGSDFSAEVNYMKETHAYTVRKEKERKQDEIDRQIIEVIFPFAGNNTACEEATANLARAKVMAQQQKSYAYKLVDDTKTSVYAEAVKLENSYKNPLEKSAKKAAADAARKKADDANRSAKAAADNAEKNTIEAAQRRVDETCNTSAK
ncbi:MAG TPA: cytochrome c [Bacteroidia bacterium]|nr:cytochrome c [Bacteroidia bacterium]